MQKITVKDCDGDFHSYVGQQFKAFDKAGTVEIFDHEKNQSVAKFQNYRFFKVGEDAKTTQRPPPDAPAYDARLADMAGRTSSPDKMTTFTEQPAKEQPLDPFTAAEMERRGAPVPPDAGMLAGKKDAPPAAEPPKKKRPSKKDAAPEVKNPVEDATLSSPVPDESAMEKLLGPLVDRTLEIMDEKGMLPPNPALLESLKQSGAFVSPEQAIANAEARHARRKNCKTCGGKGTVKDPDSQDPLDTIICPEC